jgi:hypothetical protein
MPNLGIDDYPPLNLMPNVAVLYLRQYHSRVVLPAIVKLERL